MPAYLVDVDRARSDRGQMRIRRLLILVVSATVSVTLLGLVRSPGAAAGCVGTTLAVGASAEPGPQPSKAAAVVRGQPATVSGIFFHAGCEDTGSSSFLGCRAAPPSDPQSPLTGVQLILVQGDRTWILGTADAADREAQYAISWNVSIPDDVAAGPAELRASDASLAVQIT